MNWNPSRHEPEPACVHKSQLTVMPKVLHLVPTHDAVQVVNVPALNITKIKNSLVKAEVLEAYGFWRGGFRYTLWMNENGIAEDTVANPCADGLLKKLCLGWGGRTLTGSYVITKHAEDEEGEPRFMDMDLTPDEFVGLFNASRLGSGR